jgi:acetyltransferase
VRLRAGTNVPARPIGPQDAKRDERRFHRLSQRTRYQRFMQHLAELIAVGRYAPRPQGGAEFALVVADEWQRKGLGRALLELARHLGFEVLERDGAELTMARRLK